MSGDRADWLPAGWCIEAATLRHADQLGEIEARARRPLGEVRGGPAWLQEHPPVGDWSSRIARGGVFVATIDDVVVGFLECDGPDRRGSVLVRQVFVDQEARELGFGDMLLAEALDHARGMNAETLEGEALPGDRETKNLYERAGITARKITVATSL